MYFTTYVHCCRLVICNVETSTNVYRSRLQQYEEISKTRREEGNMNCSGDLSTRDTIIQYLQQLTTAIVRAPIKRFVIKDIEQPNNQLSYILTVVPWHFL